MRISGTYIERLFIYVLPLMLFGYITLTLFMSNLNKIIIIVFSILTLVFWFIDTLWIFSKKIKPLIIDNGIYFGKEKIDIKAIDKIVNFNAGTTRWDINMIEFTFIDGSIINVLDKPQAFFQYFFTKAPSKTTTLLFEKYPNLKTKLRKTRSKKF